MKLKTKTKRRVDKKFSQYMRRTATSCMRCGSTDKQLNCSHIIPREILHLRWSPMNIVLLCVACHKYGKHSWHSNPLLSVRWLESVIPLKQLDNLVAQSMCSATVTEEDVLTIEKEIDEKK